MRLHMHMPFPPWAAAALERLCQLIHCAAAARVQLPLIVCQHDLIGQVVLFYSVSGYSGTLLRLVFPPQLVLGEFSMQHRVATD
jgi:hypothetical protein